MRRDPDQGKALSRSLAEARFARLYRQNGQDVLAFALRRTSEEDAADVVAETFLVAWRRLGDVPPGPQARLWLFAVARQTLSNQQRGERRRWRLAERLRVSLREQPAEPSEPGGLSGAAVAAMERLGEADRELLMLIAWEELTPAEAAKVLGISAVSARSRLHRARRRLQAVLGEERDRRPAANAIEIEEAR